MCPRGPFDHRRHLHTTQWTTSTSLQLKCREVFLTEEGQHKHMNEPTPLLRVERGEFNSLGKVNHHLVKGAGPVPVYHVSLSLNNGSLS